MIIPEGKIFYKGITKRKPYYKKLFWMTDNKEQASDYGKVYTFATTRPLNFMRLTNKKVKQIIKSGVLYPDIAQLFEALWGLDMSYKEQYKKLIKYDPNYFGDWYKDHFGEKGPVFGKKKGGRLSNTDTNVDLFSYLRDIYYKKNLYDGIYVPGTLSPHYAGDVRWFPPEFILFNPSTNLRRVKNSQVS
jgi:hypothetical protein